MPNVLNIAESAINTIKSLSDNKKRPIHVGEAMACWMYQTQLDGVLGYCDIALNATKDKDVINTINESKRLGLIHKKKLDEFMKAENISPSDGYVQKPAINVDTVPNGVKQTEKDIINTIQINLVTAFGLNASALSQCLRTDLQIIFFEIMTDVMIFGQSINILSEKRGWLRFPPTYHPN